MSDKLPTKCSSSKDEENKSPLKRAKLQDKEEEKKGSSIDKESDDEEIKPKNEIEIGKSVKVDKYEIKRTGTDQYNCSCIAWKLQKGGGSIRTCNHLKQYLGQEYEEDRVKGQKGGEKSKTKKKRDAKAESKSKSPKVDNDAEKKIKINLMLANVYDPEKNDPKGWYMSEKLDGVRCFWDGKNFYSRNGNLFYPPSYFKEAMPDFQLDGELWTSRDDFQKCVSIVKRQDENDEWKTIKYMIFDAPSMNDATFTERLKKLQEVVKASKNKYLTILEHRICESRDDLVAEMDRITGEGGEGVMLRRPQSKYEHKRSNELLKVKKFDDAEATVIAHEDGTGRLVGLLGALRVREEDGKEFKIGSGFNDKQRANPPKIGSKVTFKFMGRSKAGIPRFPIYMREHPGV